MENTNYTIAEQYELPSKGLIYSVPFDGKVKLRSMTVAEEMKRMNPSKSMDATLCEVIDACLVTKLPISTYDLAIPDYEYLLHKLRVVTYGTDYKMLVGCPHCGKEQSYKANLDELKVDYLDAETLKQYNEDLSFKLPVSKLEIKLRFPTCRLQDTIRDKVADFNREMAKQGVTNTENNNGDMTPLFTLETMIESINGSKMSYIELQQLIRNMSAADYNYIMKKLARVNVAFGVRKDMTIKCPSCGGYFESRFRLSSEFFGPSID